MCWIYFVLDYLSMNCLVVLYFWFVIIFAEGELLAINLQLIALAKFIAVGRLYVPVCFLCI